MRVAKRGLSLIEVLFILTIMGIVGSLFVSTLVLLLKQSQEQRVLWNTEVHLHDLELQLRDQAFHAHKLAVSEQKLELETLQGILYVYQQQEDTILCTTYSEKKIIKEQTFSLADGFLFHPQLTESNDKLQFRILQINWLRTPYAPAKAALHAHSLELQNWLQWQMRTSMPVKEVAS